MASVALVQADGKHHNLALKLAAHHLAQGDQVTLDPLHLELACGAYDRVYVAKVFTNTPDWSYLRDGNEVSGELVRGGTGYADTMHVVLPPGIESMRPAYDLFGCDHAVGFTSRGCNRRCPFCVVPDKEGGPRPVADLDDFWDGQPQIRLLDANLTAPALHDHTTALLQRLIQAKVQVDFSQGIDARALTVDHARLFAKVRYWKRLHVAWDAVGSEAAVRRGIGRLYDAGLKPYDLIVYVLVGYDTTPEQDVARVQAIRALGAMPWVMPYRRKSDRPGWEAYLTAITRWGQRMELRNVEWADYERGQWNTKRDFPLVAGTLPG